MIFRVHWISASMAVLNFFIPQFSFAQAGAPIWTNRYDGPADSEVAVGIVAHNSGMICVVGYSVSGSFSTSSYRTVAYSNAGSPLWTNTFDGIPNGEDVAYSIAADTNGFTYVTGRSSGTNSGLDFATIKISPSGLSVWTNRYHGGFSHDQGTAIALDNAGNVWVTGYSYSGGGVDWETIKYSSAGAQLRAERIANAQPTALVTDQFGNCFVAGFSTSSGTDYLIVRYSTNGSTWSRTYNRGSSDQARAVAADNEGNAIITGGADGDIVTIKYSSTGAPLWTNRYNGPGNGSDYGSAIAVDGNGDVVVAGDSQEGSAWFSAFDLLMIKYSSAGIPLWTNRYGSPNSEDRVASIVMGSAGRSFVAGNVFGGGIVLAFSPVGELLWTNRCPGAGAMTLDAAENLYLAGGSFTTTKYSGFNPSPVPLSIQKVGESAVLSWPDSRFRLQASPTFLTSFTNTASSSPWTNVITGNQLFFRLITD
jgi:hypothetical protein